MSARCGPPLQTEVHPYSQETSLKEYLKGEQMAIQAWYPLGHGDPTLQQEPVFTKLAEKYGKTTAQIILSSSPSMCSTGARIPRIS